MRRCSWPPVDQVEVERWDGHLNTLRTIGNAAGFLRVHGLSDAEAAAAASMLDLPLTLTMRGCVVYATKAALDDGARGPGRRGGAIRQK